MKTLLGFRYILVVGQLDNHGSYILHGYWSTADYSTEYIFPVNEQFLNNVIADYNKQCQRFLSFLKKQKQHTLRVTKVFTLSFIQLHSYL